MKKTLPAIFLILSSVISNVNAQPVISMIQVISGLSAPVELTNAGDGTKRIFIVQKAGTIKVYNKSYGLIGTFLDMTNDLHSSGEQGLLSMAFHPDFANNGFFYVYYTNTNDDLELARYHISANPDVADENSKVVVLTIPHPGSGNHNGGEIHFGNDGYLYLSTGDGGGAGDPPNNAQNTGVLLGKIIRIAVNTSATAPYYTIPPDNPFGNEVFAYGLRNPFRWSFDRDTYDMWIADVGQDSYEEINYRKAGQTNGVNYGWRCYEGNAEQDLSIGCNGPLSNYIFPVYTYPTPDPAGSVIGGTVYRGSTYIDLRGYYIAADYFTGTFYRVKYDQASQSATTSTQVLTPTGISDFGENEEGELFAVSLSSGAVYRISSNGPVGYRFTGNGNWSTASSWVNDTVPPASLPAGAEIIIDPAGNGECVLDIPQTIQSGAKITVVANKKFRINGNLTIQ